MAHIKAINRSILPIIRSRSLISSIKRSNYLLENALNRFKHTQYTGVKGIRNRKLVTPTTAGNDAGDEESAGGGAEGDDVALEDIEYDTLASTAMNVSREIKMEQKVFIIQPYVKWGPKKATTSPDLHLQEAEALIRSIPQWNIEMCMKVPLESLDRKMLFGKGKLEELKNLLRDLRSKGKQITCVFISKGTLTFAQKRFLEGEFKTAVMDRYSVVIQILRLHAITAEAKIQVAMAEIPYIWTHAKDANVSSTTRQGFYLTDIQKAMLKNRERKLKQELENIRSQRKLLRNKRKQKNYPIVAVVGYTNAGKTSLIKALTDEQTLQPRDQLFATLDVTAHAGLLPCKLKVIYMDTVGFMSDIPTGLIECFVATLEDAMLADVVVHVQDLSHENYIEQKRHVEDTLTSLTKSWTENDSIPHVINVGNKVDLLSSASNAKEFNGMKLVSSKTLAGINDLMLEIESKILQVTNRTKMIFRVGNGGEEMAWLYKNSAVTNVREDYKDQQNILIETIITSDKLQQFKHYFVGK